LVETARYLQTLRLDGGDLALDFVNTLGGLLSAGPNPWDEHLRSYDDVVAWGVKVGVLDSAAAERLARRGRRDPAAAQRALRETLELRDLVDAVFRPLAGGGRPKAARVEELRHRAVDSLARAELVHEGAGYRWQWTHGELESPLWPLAHAAVELLTGGPLDTLKVCGECRWLFLDQSRNRRRRWCSMEECGTSVKKRRYVESRRARRAEVNR